MPQSDRSGLRAAFSNFSKPDDNEAELKLLGRIVETPSLTEASTPLVASSYQIATDKPAASGGLIPRPLLHREVVRQLSFRCPIALATELKRKAAFNQLEQQEIIIEGIKRVLLDLSDPPSGWEG